MSGAVAVVAGATGLVGQALVHQLATDSTWAEVRALTRRPWPPELSHPTVVPSMVDYDHLEATPPWAKADQLFCALGTTMRLAGSQDAFRRVDFDYTLALARAGRNQGVQHFLLVSAIGASARSRIFYSRVKGETEDAVCALGFRSVTIARPSVLTGQRAERRVGEAVGTALARLAPRRWRPVAATTVARALVIAAKQDRPGITFLENTALHGIRD
jgi:uncharacterized protein YbjT (DUF2867 family)